MTSTDICRIIVACGKANLKSLKYNGLELSFEHSEAEVLDLPLFPRSDSTIPFASEPPLYDNGTNTDVPEDMEIDESLLITDPILWEETQSIEPTNA